MRTVPITEPEAVKHYRDVTNPRAAAVLLALTSL
jgi:hypothetical protein